MRMRMVDERRGHYHGRASRIGFVDRERRVARRDLPLIVSLNHGRF